jgi:hypothetical protein
LKANQNRLGYRGVMPPVSASRPGHKLGLFTSADVL